MSYRIFLREGPPAGLAAMAAALLVLWAQYATWPGLGDGGSV